VLLGGALARAPVAEVVGVGADRQRQALDLGERHQQVEQLRLAEVAAVGAVGGVAGTLQLVGGDHHVPHAQLAGEQARVGQLVLGEAGRDPGGRHGALPQRLGGRRQQEGGVRAAGEGDHHAAGRLQLVAEPPPLAVEGVHGRHSRSAVPARGRSVTVP
jgi:hypothetical protein